MFSKEQSTLLRKEFWTSFGKSFPRKWILYNTKIKGLSFKFVADRKKAMVVLDLEHPDKIANELLFEQLLSLKNILERDYKLNVLFDGEYELDSGKKIHRIYQLHQSKFSIYNKQTWKECYLFYLKSMSKFESFFEDYKDYINQSIS